VVLMIVGNKTDLASGRRVELNEAKTYAASVGAEHRECSAKENIGISSIFDHLVKLMVERANMTNGSTDSSNRINRTMRRGPIQLIDDRSPGAIPVKKSCC